MTILLALTVVTATCTAVDGDTLRCRIDGQPRTTANRLIGIDAPELPGHCRKGRACAAGDPHASTRSLARAVHRQTVILQPVGRDRYGRTLARAATKGGDLSCHQLRHRAAIYVQKWDTARQVQRTCPAEARPDHPARGAGAKGSAR